MCHQDMVIYVNLKGIDDNFTWEIVNNLRHAHDNLNKYFGLHYFRASLAQRKPKLKSEVSVVLKDRKVTSTEASPA